MEEEVGIPTLITPPLPLLATAGTIDADTTADADADATATTTTSTTNYYY